VFEVEILPRWTRTDNTIKESKEERVKLLDCQQEKPFWIVARIDTHNTCKKITEMSYKSEDKDQVNCILKRIRLGKINAYLTVTEQSG